MILHGENVILKMDGVTVAASRSCEVSITTDTEEIAPTGDGKWKRYRKLRMGWQATCNHFVTNLIRNAQMVYKNVSLEMSVKSDEGLPFDGFVSGATIQQQSLAIAPDAIVWDKTAKKFLARTGTVLNYKYYSNWLDGEAYITPSDYNTYYCDGSSYIYMNNNLNADKLTGSAIVTAWRAQFTKPNLAQGNFEFLGNGALNPASLP
jgi:hypothetical protein